MARRFQFSIRWIFVVTAMIAVICTALWAKPTPMSGGLFLLLQVAIPTCAIVGTVQGRGYVRAFCIGAALPSSFGVIPWWQFVGANFASGGPFNNLLSVGAFEKDQTTFVGPLP
jgi:hypothetical protein